MPTFRRRKRRRPRAKDGGEARRRRARGSFALATYNILDGRQEGLYSAARALKAAGATHVGTHGIRHRSATDIANSGIPVKVGMVLTAHKTVTMFMRYIHTEDDPVREAAELVANRRKTITGTLRYKEATV